MCEQTQNWDSGVGQPFELALALRTPAKNAIKQTAGRKSRGGGSGWDVGGGHVGKHGKPEKKCGKLEAWRSNRKWSVENNWLKLHQPAGQLFTA